LKGERQLLSTAHCLGVVCVVVCLPMCVCVCVCVEEDEAKVIEEGQQNSAVLFRS